MKKLYDECFHKLKDVMLLGSATGVIGWDQETKMPEAASNLRAEQLATLSGLIHEKFVDPSVGKALKKLHCNPKGLTADQRVCVREWMRDYERSVKVPEKLVRELARVSSLAQTAWINARKKSDFKAFAPWLKKMVELKRREAESIGYKRSPYDALLDVYEPYMTSAELDPIMEELREGLIPIIREIKGAKNKPAWDVLTKHYPEGDQEPLCKDVMAALGLDMNAARLDRSAHPFCCGMAPTDVRITTRYDERWLPQALYGVIHESGHALYEQGLPIKQFGTPLGEAVSLGIHESQSRMWENIIGRSRPFMDFLFPRLKKRFGKSLKGINADSFYLALNRVKPTPIRVEADEITYNLHIILRYELEKGLVEGSIKVKDLPGLWNERMKHYLGIKPKNDAQGVLQDTHWAQGLIGYFPTYLLGNLYASQLWHRMRRDIPSIDSKVSRGNFAPLLAWLRKKVHRHGRRFAPSELIRRATGKKPSADYFLEYLRKKYGGIYGISSW